MPPRLTKEQLDQVKYVSLQDYCQRVDELDNIDDKLAFSTAYILSHGQDHNVQPDHSLADVIKVAHMKIADKSADIKEFYQETQVNKGIGDTMVNPTVKFAGQDFANQMFIANPVGYLKGKAQERYDEIGRKSWKSQDDIRAQINCGHLKNEVFTDQFAASVTAAIKKPTTFDVNARLENAFGGPQAFKKAVEATKPGVFSRMFGTRSIEARNLDEAYKAFNNPSHALHGNLPTVEKAAREYLQHVLPNYRPTSPSQIPTEQDLANLSGTKKARALLSLNLLKAAKEQSKMELDYKEMVEACEKKNLTFESLPDINDDMLIIDDKTNVFQNDLQKDLKEDEVENNNVEAENEKGMDDLQNEGAQIE